MVSALLFGESLRKILTLDAGFQRDGVLVMDMDFTRLNIPSDQRAQFRERIVERVRSLPEVQSAAETDTVPLGGSYWNDEVVVNGEVHKPWVDMGHVTPEVLPDDRDTVVGRSYFQRSRYRDLPKSGDRQSGVCPEDHGNRKSCRQDVQNQCVSGSAAVRV